MARQPEMLQELVATLSNHPNLKRLELRVDWEGQQAVPSFPGQPPMLSLQELSILRMSVYGQAPRLSDLIRVFPSLTSLEVVLG